MKQQHSKSNGHRNGATVVKEIDDVLERTSAAEMLYGAFDARMADSVSPHTACIMREYLRAS